jgi:hypothetical protein
MYTKFSKLLVLSICVFKAQAQNKIIYLISPPRTLSTVLLRFMHARGDMIVFNEPSQYAYLSMLSGGGIPGGYNTDYAFRNYAEVKRTLLNAREDGMVFVKDPSCAAYASLYKDEAFLTDPNIEFCFIIRDPHASVVSYYKALALRTRGLDEFGWRIERKIYELQYALYKRITKLRNKAPLVLSCEDIVAFPEKALKAFCNQLGLDFDKSMLSWPSMENSFDPVEWHDSKTLAACKQWHNDAIVSTHFKPSVRQFDINYKGKPTFAEFDSKYKAILTEIYENYMYFYNKMYVHRIHI